MPDVSGENFRKIKFANSENPKVENLEVWPVVGNALTPMHFLWCLYNIILLLICLPTSTTDGVVIETP